MQNIKRRNSFLCYIILSLLFCFASTTALAKTINKASKSSPIKKEFAGVKSNKLLDILKWNELYDLERKKDITYLLGAVDGQTLSNLTPEQKKQIIVLMQDLAIKQLTEDRQYFRTYLIEQYSQFFTTDELDRLIKYFNTELMQMVINAKVNKSAMDIKDIKAKLNSGKNDDKDTISSMTSSYLHTRYSRFQEKINPIIAKMIAERMKTVLDSVIEKIPELTKYVQDKKNG